LPKGGIHEANVENSRNRTFRRIGLRDWSTGNSQSPNLDPKNLKISLVNRQAAESYEQFDKAYQELFLKGKPE
jgi:hypothetical protein